jgi:hypothetical protein
LALLTKVERDYLSGQREFTEPQQRYIRCRLRKKIRMLGDDLISLGIPRDSVAAYIAAALQPAATVVVAGLAW